MLLSLKCAQIGIFLWCVRTRSSCVLMSSVHVLFWVFFGGDPCSLLITGQGRPSKWVHAPICNPDTTISSTMERSRRTFFNMISGNNFCYCTCVSALSMFLATLYSIPRGVTSCQGRYWYKTGQENFSVMNSKTWRLTTTRSRIYTDLYSG